MHPIPLRVNDSTISFTAPTKKKKNRIEALAVEMNHKVNLH